MTKDSTSWSGSACGLLHPTSTRRRSAPGEPLTLPMAVSLDGLLGCAENELSLPLPVNTSQRKPVVAGDTAMVCLSSALTCAGQRLKEHG